MKLQEAIAFFKLHSEWLSENWTASPEGTEYKKKFDLAIETVENHSHNGCGGNCTCNIKK